MTRRSSARRWWGAAAFALVGAAALVWLVHRTGPALLVQALGRVPRFFVVPLAIEGLRIAIETMGTRRLYARDIDPGPLFRAGFIGYAVAALAPAGRATAEATKAALLARHSRAADTSAVAATVQACSLASIALFSTACTAFAALVSPTLAWTFAIQAAVAGGAAALILGGARAAPLARLVSRFAPRFGPAVAAVREHARAHRLGRPLLAFVVSRALQLVQYATILLAVTGRLRPTSDLLAFGVAMVGGSLGDSVPAQLGVSDATFAAAAGPLGMARGDAIAIALVAHAVQIVWIAVGLLLPLFAHDRGAVHRAWDEAGLAPDRASNAPS